MKKKDKKLFRCIEAETASEFEQQISAIYADHPAAEVLFREKTFLAYVTWTEVELVPETAHEELLLKGVDLRCRDCPYLERKNDRRLRYHECGLTGETKFRNDPACDILCGRYWRREVDKDEL